MNPEDKESGDIYAALAAGAKEAPEFTIAEAYFKTVPTEDPIEITIDFPDGTQEIIKWAELTEGADNGT